MNWKYWVRSLGIPKSSIQSCYEVDGTSRCSEKIPLEAILPHAIANKLAASALNSIRLFNLERPLKLRIGNDY